MKIYDISQEIFGYQVYPGDPTPQKRVLSSMEKGDLYNLTAFSMCAHNGTHIDAPFHFIKGGKTVDSIGLDTLIGMAYVAEHNGNVTLLKLSIASVISIISDVLKRVKGIWVVYVMSVCRRHRRQFDITIVFVLTVL